MAVSGAGDLGLGRLQRVGIPGPDRGPGRVRSSLDRYEVPGAHRPRIPAGHVVDGLDRDMLVVLDLEHLEHADPDIADPHVLPDSEFDHVSTIPTARIDSEHAFER
jgi:hypothetical protein